MRCIVSDATVLERKTSYYTIEIIIRMENE